jgi:chromate transporter
VSRFSAPDTTEAKLPPRIGLPRLFAAFLRLGCFGFGGGMAGWLHREMVLRRRWIDDDEFLAMLALGQVMPGSNGVKLTILIGERLGGAAGATVALVGLLAAPFAIAVAIGAAYAGLGGHPIVQAMLDGVAAAVIGLTFATGLRGLSQSKPGASGIAIAGATVICVGVLRWPLLPVGAALAPVSIALAFAQARRRRHA